MPRDSRTRAEGDFSKFKVCYIISRYIESIWEGITERLTHFDEDGKTSWSEAPAMEIFSILQTICDKKPGIKLPKLTKLFRIIKEGPQPGIILAKSLIESSIEKWPSSYSPVSNRSAAPNSSACDVRHVLFMSFV